MAYGLGIRVRWIAARVTLSMAVTFGLAGAGVAPSKTPPKPAAIVQPAPVSITRETVHYGPRDDEVGDLYRPSTPAPPRPSVILVHGGGWAGGNRDTLTQMCSALASRGFVVLNIDYRLASSSDPSTQWPAQLVDAQLAVRFLRANSQMWGVDPGRMAAVGDSVGGTLALMLGLRSDIVPSDRSNLYPGVSPAVQAVVDMFGPVEFLKLHGPDWDPVNTILFGTVSPTPVQVQLLSPLRFINHKPDAVLIVHGNADDVVPLEQSRIANAILRVQGINAAFVPFSGGHEFRDSKQLDIDHVFLSIYDFLVRTLHPSG